MAAGGSVLVLAAVWTAVMYFLEKKELEGFMADIGRLLDTMEGIWNQAEEICPVEKFREITGLEEETLLSRLGGRFCRLYEMMDNARTNTQEAVSYTHLDVYKRQACIRPFSFKSVSVLP